MSRLAPGTPLVTLCLCAVVGVGCAHKLELVLLPQELRLLDRLESVPIENAARGERLRTWLEEEGCVAPHLHTQEVQASPNPNVICTLPGASSSTIVVGAHFDKVPEGDGVSDNWSGVSLLPSLYSALTGQPRHHTFVFVGFTDEEAGLVGSSFYVSSLSAQGRERVRAMINLDSLGWARARFWWDDADPELASQLEEVAHKMELRVRGMHFPREFASDSVPFDAAGLPTITIHAIDRTTFRRLHTRRDNLESIKIEAYVLTYRLLTRYLWALDDSLRE